jgi:type I restriction enzyme S subunit
MNTVTQNPATTPKPKNTNHLSEWREIKLGKLIITNKKSIGKDYPYSKILYLDTGSITCNKIESLQEFDIKNAPSRAKRLVENEDIIYSLVRPNQLHYGYIKDPQRNLVVSTGFVTITCKKDTLHPLFLYYYLIQPQTTEYLHSIAEASTSAYPSLKPSDIESLEILLPPLPEQRAIAEVLSSLDDKIDLLHRQNKTLEALAETIFRQWFIEEADESWEVGKLGDLIVPKKGKNLTKSEAIAGNYPVVAGGLEPSCYHNQANTKAPVVTISASGANAGFVRIYYTPVWSSDSSYIDETITPFVYFSYIFLKVNQKQLIDKQEGSAQPHIYPSHIMELEMVKYPNILIEKFEKEVSDIFQKIKHNTQQIHTLTQLRDTLLPKLMSGEIRLDH